MMNMLLPTQEIDIDISSITDFIQIFTSFYVHYLFFWREDVAV